MKVNYTNFLLSYIGLIVLGIFLFSQIVKLVKFWALKICGTGEGRERGLRRIKGGKESCVKV